MAGQKEDNERGEPTLPRLRCMGSEDTSLHTPEGCRKALFKAIDVMITAIRNPPKDMEIRIALILESIGIIFRIEESLDQMTGVGDSGGYKQKRESTGGALLDLRDAAHLIRQMLLDTAWANDKMVREFLSDQRNSIDSLRFTY